MPLQMINGAIEIIRGVSSSHIDPLLLPVSHGNASLGYIVIAYHDQPEAYDMLFLKGKTVTECARINRDIRVIQPMESVRSHLRADRGRALVYLFQATEQSMDRFARTFHYEPCLKLQVDALTRRQRASLVDSAGCRKGLLELDRFSGTIPSIEIYEFGTPEELALLESRMKHGRLILYDTERNRDLGKGDQVERPGPAAPPASSAPAGMAVDPASTSTGETQPGSPRSTDTEPKHPESRQTNSRIILLENIEPPRLSDPTIPPADPQSVEAAGQARPTARNQDAGEREYVRLFEKIFRSFRRKAFECFAGKLEPALRIAEEEVRLLTPDFDITNLSAETAPGVLELMDVMVRDAPMMKRSRLKSTACTLVEDLYSKQYDMLEKRGAIDRVEQFYYRLKE